MTLPLMNVSFEKKEPDKFTVSPPVDGKPRSLRKKTEIRKQEIVSIAWELVSKQGAGAVTIKNIASKAGISEAAVYRHFKDKSSILTALVDSFEEYLLGSIDHPLKNYKNPLVKLREIMRAHLDITEQKQRIMFALTAESLHFNDDHMRKKILGVIEKYKSRIKGILQEAKDAGLVRKDINLDGVSLIFFGMIEAAVIQYALSNYTVKPTTKFNTTWKIFLNGIYATQPDL